MVKKKRKGKCGNETNGGMIKSEKKVLEAPFYR